MLESYYGLEQRGINGGIVVVEAYEKVVMVVVRS